MLDRSLNTKKKRRIAGGVLISISLLFGGLAATVMLLRHEENGEQYEDVYIE